MSSTPTVNADPTEILQTYSINIDGTEVGHWLGKEIFLWQQAVTYMIMHTTQGKAPMNTTLCHKSLELRSPAGTWGWGDAGCAGKYLARTVLLFCWFLRQSTLHDKWMGRLWHFAPATPWKKEKKKKTKWRNEKQVWAVRCQEINLSRANKSIFPKVSSPLTPMSPRAYLHGKPSPKAGAPTANQQHCSYPTYTSLHKQLWPGEEMLRLVAPPATSQSHCKGTPEKCCFAQRCCDIQKAAKRIFWKHFSSF